MSSCVAPCEHAHVQVYLGVRRHGMCAVGVPCCLWAGELAHAYLSVHFNELLRCVLVFGGPIWNSFPPHAVIDLLFQLFRSPLHGLIAGVQGAQLST